jgi:hypothetical protein
VTTPATDIIYCSMVPVLAVGFDDLQKRVDAQTKQATVHQEKLQVHAVRSSLRKLLLTLDAGTEETNRDTIPAS